jgi:AmmeMemoRadiSam system protein B
MNMSACQFKKVRLPAFAGSFYPAVAEDLRQLVQFCLAGGTRRAIGGSYKAFVLPHAGFIYSGPVAGSGYLCLEADREEVKRVILLGPSHRLGFAGLAVSEASAFATPLGEVTVDLDAVGELLALPQVRLLEAAHKHEHSLEVHLPFLQVLLAGFQLVPLVVGDASESEVAAVLEKLWGGPETRVIVSSDLSHYHDYTLARRLDAETATRIEDLLPVAPDQACGAMPLNGLLRAARQHRLAAHTIDLRNSGDTAGGRDRVVGYGAFVFGAGR